MFIAIKHQEYLDLGAEYLYFILIRLVTAMLRWYLLLEYLNFVNLGFGIWDLGFGIWEI